MTSVHTAHAVRLCFCDHIAMPCHAMTPFHTLRMDSSANPGVTVPNDPAAVLSAGVLQVSGTGVAEAAAPTAPRIQPLRLPNKLHSPPSQQNNSPPSQHMFTAPPLPSGGPQGRLASAARSETRASAGTAARFLPSQPTCVQVRSPSPTPPVPRPPRPVALHHYYHYIYIYIYILVLLLVLLLLLLL